MSKRKASPLPGVSPLEAALTAILERTTRLDGAACIGHSELFDPPSDGEARETTELRHSDAVRLCWKCPVIGACRDWALGEPEIGRGARRPNARCPKTTRTAEIGLSSVNARNRRPCTHRGCTALTRAASRLCHLHRPAVIVTADRGLIHISPATRTFTHADALKLADDIIDAIETATERN